MLFSSRCPLKSPGLCGHFADTAPGLRELCEALNLQSSGNEKTESMCPSQTRAGRKGPADGRSLNYTHTPSLQIGNINTTRGVGHTYPWSASLGTSDTNCGLFSLLYHFTLLIRECLYCCSSSLTLKLVSKLLGLKDTLKTGLSHTGLNP